MESRKKPAYTRVDVSSVQKVWEKERPKGLKASNQRVKEFLSIASGNNPKNLKYIADVQMLSDDHPWKNSMKKTRRSLKQ
jgi:hypothetical protein